MNVNKLKRFKGFQRCDQIDKKAENDINDDLQLVRSDIRSAMTPDPSARIVVSFILLLFLSDKSR